MVFGKASKSRKSVGAFLALAIGFSVFSVFNADLEVAKIYKNNRQCFKKLKKKLPEYFLSFPAKKDQIIKAITNNEENLKEITKIIHPEIRKKMHIFLKNNNKNKIKS